MSEQPETARCQACRTSAPLSQLRPVASTGADNDVTDLADILSPSHTYICIDHDVCLARVRANRESAWREAFAHLVLFLPDGRPGTICHVTTDELDAHAYAQSLPGVVVDVPIAVDYRPKHRKRPAP